MSEVSSGEDIIWIVVYTHEQGTDMSAYRSESVAKKKAIAIAEEWCEDYNVDTDVYHGLGLVENWYELSSGREDIFVRSTNIEE